MEDGKELVAETNRIIFFKMCSSRQHLIIFICVCTWLSTCVVRSFGAVEQCIDGVYHKLRPTPETAEYKFCTPWKNLTCCTTQLDNEIVQGDSPKKYNSTWHMCGNLSPNCSKHWKRQVGDVNELPNYTCFSSALATQNLFDL